MLGTFRLTKVSAEAPSFDSDWEMGVDSGAAVELVATGAGCAEHPIAAKRASCIMNEDRFMLRLRKERVILTEFTIHCQRSLMRGTFAQIAVFNAKSSSLAFTAFC